MENMFSKNRMESNIPEQDMEKIKKLPILAVVKVGNFSNKYTAKSVAENLKDIKFGFDYFQMNFDRVLCPELSEISLVVVRPIDMGLVGEKTLNEIYAKAQSIGLGLCPEETGFQFLLQGNKVGANEILTFASKLISSSYESIQFLIKVYRTLDGFLALGVKDHQSHYLFHDQSEFVFCVSSKTKTTPVD